MSRQELGKMAGLNILILFFFLILVKSKVGILEGSLKFSATILTSVFTCTQHNFTLNELFLEYAYPKWEWDG